MQGQGTAINDRPRGKCCAVGNAPRDLEAPKTSGGMMAWEPEPRDVARKFNHDRKTSSAISPDPAATSTGHDQRRRMKMMQLL